MWSRDIKSKIRNIIDFCKILQVFLAKAHVTMLLTIAWHNDCKNQPLIHKLYSTLVSKTLVLDILKITIFQEIES